MSSPRVEKVYEKYAWVILFLLGVSMLPGVYILLILGTDVVVGVVGVAFVIPTTLIAVTSYRKGRRWAWYAMWYVPVFVAASTYSQAVSGMIPWEANFFIVIPLLGLLLPYRKFFPKTRVTPS